MTSQSRFISEDPLGLAAGPNVYAYVGNDPLNFTDPEGQFGLVGAGIGGVIGAVSGGVTAAANGAGPGGIVKGALLGGLFGAGVGILNPLASEGAGAAAVALTYGTTGLAAGGAGAIAGGGSGVQILTALPPVWLLHSSQAKP